MFTSNKQTITMDRVTLLEILKKNREEYREKYELAKEAFLLRVKEDLKAAMKIVKSDDFEKIKSLRFVPSPPPNFISKFDTIISMLEYSVDDTIELDSTNFRWYVENKWDWVDQFDTLVDSYKIAGSTLK